jgi:hypothetical protein
MAETLACALFKFVPTIINWLRGVKCSSPLNGLVLPFGKSQLVKSLQAHQKNLKLIDLEAQVLLEISTEDQQKLQELKNKQEVQTYSQKFKVLAKTYVESLRKNFKKEKFILVASDMDLLIYCGVKKSNITSFVPSNAFWKQISESMDDPTLRQVYEMARQNLIINNKSLNVFSDFSELYAMSSRIFGLKAIL